MNLHIVRWDEDSALWRARVLKNVDPQEPIVKCDRDGQPWLAWKTMPYQQEAPEYVELESVAARISLDGDIMLYYRPALEYWRNINLEAACHVEWLEREWPTFGAVALEELNAIAKSMEEEESVIPSFPFEAN